MPDAPRSFFVQPWMTRATALLGVLQLGGALVLHLLSDVVGTGPVVPAIFAVGGALTLYLGYWTAATPLATVSDEGVELRPALLAAPVTLRFADVRAFAQLPPGWLVFLGVDGEETRIVVTALSEADRKAFLAALLERLTEVSYVERA